MTSGPAARAGPVALTYDNGVITRLTASPDPPSTGERRFLLPAFANAHDHARPLALSSFGAAFMPLETWLLRSILATPPDAYLAAAAPLARAARAGCASVMVHYTRASGRLSLPEEAAEVARAARDVGVRIAFALAVRDQNPLVYGDHDGLLQALPNEVRQHVMRYVPITVTTPADYLRLIDEIDAATRDALVDVQYGPAAPQWCSTPLLEAIARASADTGRRVHMHLLETRYQRAWADRMFPDGIVQHLKNIGLLSPRLTLAHCVHARPDELDLIAEAGATIVTNFSSNLQIKSGLAPIAEAVSRGCRIAVGMDGLAFDEDDDMLRELRFAHTVHSGTGFDETWSRADFLTNATSAGRAATGAPGDGRLVTGAPADFISIDLDSLDRDRLMHTDPLDLLFARGNKSHICDVVVAGRTIVAEQQLTGVDIEAVETELRARFRHALPSYEGLITAWPTLHDAVRTWMVEQRACC
jgi:cytosine/adenosine deaminase-related metal-dependent hydrolase